MSTSSLEKGHVADMYHAGTAKYYRVQVLLEVTEEEANGPTYENRPITTFGGLVGGSAPRHEPAGSRYWRAKCIALLIAQGGGAALNAIVEEGHDEDRVDYKSLYEKWSAEACPVAQGDGDSGDEHV